MNNCRFYRSVYNIDKSVKCSNICSGCIIIKKYKKFIKSNKIDIINDIANFRIEKHQNKKED